MLIEVVISALLVGLIAIGTLTGLEGATRVGARERANAQATVIAQQDEDRLRGLPGKELSEGLGSITYEVAENGMCLEKSAGAWNYYNAATTTSCEAVTGYKGKAYTGTVFTVTSSAAFVSASKETLTCETTGGEANYIQTTTSVNWSSANKHSPVTASSLVTVPTDATLLVRVKNSKTEPVSGATVAVTDPSTASTVTAQQITPASGCVIFGDLAPGTVKVAASKAGWLEKTGKAAVAKTTSVSKTSLAEVEFTIEGSGGIEAKFVNSAGKAVEGSTFVAFQTEMGSPAFNVGGETSKPPATFATLEDLYPFATDYKVYAGDCEANKPATVGVTGAKEEPVPVKPGEVNKSASVEEAPINGKVYQGSKESEGVLAKSESAMIINTACKGKEAGNVATVTGEHEVKITAGELVPKYQPYATSLELCVVGEDGTKYYENTFKLENKATTGSTATPMYLDGTGSKTATATTKC